MKSSARNTGLGGVGPGLRFPEGVDMGLGSMPGFRLSVTWVFPCVCGLSVECHLDELSFSSSLKRRCRLAHSIFLKVLRERKSIWRSSVVSGFLFCLPALCRERDHWIDVCTLASWNRAPTPVTTFLEQF